MFLYIFHNAIDGFTCQIIVNINTSILSLKYPKLLHLIKKAYINVQKMYSQKKRSKKLRTDLLMNTYT